jgi:hypothetical protein
MSILVLTSDTLIGTPATGNIEYNGQFFGTDSNASRAQLQRITQGTSVASTSGTFIDFTGLPAWVKRITVMYAGVSTNGTSALILQLGTSSGVVTSGYVGTMSYDAARAIYTTGIGIHNNGSASGIGNGTTQVSLLGSNTWVGSGTVGCTGAGTGETYSSGSHIALGGTLDRVRITTVNGTDAFDAGSINILYEG